MKYAIIDTETSGLFDFSKPADAEGQPRLASLAIVVLDEQLALVSEHEFLVKPDGWTMNPEASKVNGLTDEYLRDLGRPISEVLDAYVSLVNAGHVIAAYNAQFDTKVVRGELRRAGRPDMFESTPNVCLMRACTDVVRIPAKNGRGFKFPKLSEACAFFQIDQPAAHSALGDAKSATTLLRALIRHGITLEPAVHYAKNRPDTTPPSRPQAT